MSRLNGRIGQLEAAAYNITRVELQRILREMARVVELYTDEETQLKIRAGWEKVLIRPPRDKRGRR